MKPFQSKYDCSESKVGDIICLNTPTSLLTPVVITKVDTYSIRKFNYQYCHNVGIKNGCTGRLHSRFIPYEIVMMAVSGYTKVELADVNHKGHLSQSLFNKYFMEAFQRLDQEIVYKLITNCFSWHREKFVKSSDFGTSWYNIDLTKSMHKFKCEMLHIWTFDRSDINIMEELETFQNSNTNHMIDASKYSTKAYLDPANGVWKSKPSNENENENQTKENTMPNNLFKVTKTGSEFNGHYGEKVTTDADGFILLKMVSLSVNSDAPIIQAFKAADLEAVRPWTFKISETHYGQNGSNHRHYVAPKGSVKVGDVFLNNAGGLLRVKEVDTKADTTHVLKAFKLAGEMFDSTVKSPADVEDVPVTTPKRKTASKAKK